MYTRPPQQLSPVSPNTKLRNLKHGDKCGIPTLMRAVSDLGSSWGVFFSLESHVDSGTKQSFLP